MTEVDRHPTWTLAESDDRVVILPARIWDDIEAKARRGGQILYNSREWSERGLVNFVVWASETDNFIVMIRGES